MAPKFVFGFGDELLVSGDAFDVLLGELEDYMSRLDTDSPDRYC